jgi:hypothetical protein
MMVDVPVTISIDVDGDKVEGFNFRRKAADQRVFTMRYPVDPNSQEHAQFCLGYPPPPNAHWMTDADGVLFELITGKADKEIRRRVEADPESYMAEARAP